MVIDVFIQLFYTRGTPIPMTLTISSSDAQALDLLSSPRSISVYLRRRVRSSSMSSYIPNQSPSMRRVPTNNRTEIGGMRDYDDIIDQAVWWASSEGPTPGQTRTRSLNGEIHLPASLKPSCLIGHFSIEYSVDVLPFNTPGFRPSVYGPMLQQSVDVCTLFARGPRARAYAPPGYGPDVGISDNYSIPPVMTLI